VIITVLPTIVIAIVNLLIFTHTRRSICRVQATDENNNTVLTQRNSRPLKHMLFMFAVFVSGWLIIYVADAIDLDGKTISHPVLDGLGILPSLSLLAEIINLFLYNHELRKYFTARTRIDTTTGLAGQPHQHKAVICFRLLVKKHHTASNCIYHLVEFY
jgi:hypothetical protein